MVTLSRCSTPIEGPGATQKQLDLIAIKERRAVLQLKRNSFHEQVAKVNMFVHVHMCTYLNSGWVLLCFPALVYCKKKKGKDVNAVRVTIVKKSSRRQRCYSGTSTQIRLAKERKKKCSGWCGAQTELSVE